MLACAAAVDARGMELPGGFQLEPGGRMEYRLSIEKNGSPYYNQWDFDGEDFAGATRLMLDLRVLSARYGSLYLKGATARGPEDSKDGRTLFSFAQGDYARSWRRDASSVGVRFFSNERRFHTGEYLAPALYDDFAAAGGENRGVRLEGTLDNWLRVESVFASLGDGWDEARKFAFVRAAYLSATIQLSLSYVYDAPAADAALGRALLKSELVWFYRNASIICSYEQSRFDRKGFFVPHLLFDPHVFVGDNFSSILPDEGAFFASLRIMTLPFRKLGTIDIVYDYFAVGEDFVNDLGLVSGEAVGYRCGAYFKAPDVYLNGRVRFGKTVRSSMEQDTEERVDASVWGGLNNGMDFALRGGWTRTSGADAAAATSTRVLGIATFHAKNTRNGIHCMLKDADTDHAAMAYAWSSRVVLNPDFAIDVRFLLSDEYQVRDAVFGKLEFRPSQRIYAYLSYGRQYAGDDPFMLEDNDLYLRGIDPSIYTVSIRGDF
jgi:hypothetical protein